MYSHYIRHETRKQMSRESYTRRSTPETAPVDANFLHLWTTIQSCFVSVLTLVSLRSTCQVLHWEKFFPSSSRECDCSDSFPYCCLERWRWLLPPNDQNFKPQKRNKEKPLPTSTSLVSKKTWADIPKPSRNTYAQISWKAKRHAQMQHQMPRGSKAFSKSTKKSWYQFVILL